MFKEIPINKYSLAKKRLLHGVGINDANYMTILKFEGKVFRCPYYIKWKDMIRRCYSSVLHAKRPTYISCSVSDEWLTFSNFKNWMIKQDWEDKHLDKDLLIPENKLYSKETCLFVTSEVNGFLHENKKTRGKLPLGVSFHKASGKHTANIRSGGASEYCGLFDNQNLAEIYYLKRKAQLAIALSEKQSNKVTAKALNKRAQLYLTRCKELNDVK
jgi:hypothetical protein